MRRHVSESHRPTSRTLDEALFRAWQSGDVEARDAAWTLLWTVLSSTAQKFCRRFTRDQATARERASSAIADACVEVERRVSGGAIAWRGEEAFVSWASAQVIFRCRDQCRRSVRWLKRIEIGNGQGDEKRHCRLDALVICPARQEDDLVRSECARDGVRRFVGQLAALRELCRNTPALEAVVDQMQMYCRQCLIDSLPSGIDAAALTLDELAEISRPESIDPTKPAVYQWIMQRLEIDRNTLYQRMKRIHALWRRWRGSPQKPLIDARHARERSTRDGDWRNAFRLSAPMCPRTCWK